MRRKQAGDTVGGSFEVIARGVPVGLGSYVQWDRKLDGRLAQALMSIPAIKAVGDRRRRRGRAASGLASARRDRVRDPSARTGESVIARPTNRAGGLEGGVTNGEELRVTGYMKPISTLMKPLRSVDLTTLEEAPAAIERSDVCAVPAAAVVGEAMVASSWPTRCSSASAAIRCAELQARVAGTGARMPRPRATACPLAAQRLTRAAADPATRGRGPAASPRARSPPSRPTSTR